MHRPFHIDLRSLPEGGKDISGTESAAFFEMPDGDTAQATGPLKYDLHLERDDGKSWSQAGWRPFSAWNAAAAWSDSSTGW